MKMTDLKYNNPALKGTSEWYGKPLQMYNDKGECLIADTIRCWVDWPHYKTNVADQRQIGGVEVGLIGMSFV